MARAKTGASLSAVLGLGFRVYNPKALRTQNIRLLGPKTILYKAFGLFRALG